LPPTDLLQGMATRDLLLHPTRLVVIATS
jgi:hypothetical protein